MLKPLFDTQTDKQYDCLDTTLLDLIKQFSFDSFFDPFFGNGRVFGKLAWDKVYGAFISDTNNVLVNFFHSLRADPYSLFQSLLYKDNSYRRELVHFWYNQRTEELNNELLLSFCAWSTKLRHTNIVYKRNTGLGIVRNSLDPVDLLFMQPKDKEEQYSVDSLLPELTEKHNWILVVPYRSDNVAAYKRYQQIITGCQHWLIVYNKGERHE